MGHGTPRSHPKTRGGRRQEHECVGKQPVSSMLAQTALNNLSAMRRCCKSCGTQPNCNQISSCLSLSLLEKRQVAWHVLHGICDIQPTQNNLCKSMGRAFRALCARPVFCMGIGHALTNLKGYQKNPCKIRGLIRLQSLYASPPSAASMYLFALPLRDHALKQDNDL
eukprot:scaffold128679_cov14-Tisochrysis_lutea.AAC.1